MSTVHSSTGMDPIFVCPESSIQVIAQHGTIGWRCNLENGHWQKLIFCFGRGWLPYREWGHIVLYSPKALALVR